MAEKWYLGEREKRDPSQEIARRVDGAEREIWSESEKGRDAKGEKERLHDFSDERGSSGKGHWGQVIGGGSFVQGKHSAHIRGKV